MLDLFHPVLIAIPGETRRVLLMDVNGEVTPDLGQIQPRRASKFDGLTVEEYRSYRRNLQNARYAARKAARK